MTLEQMIAAVPSNWNWLARTTDEGLFFVHIMSPEFPSPPPIGVKHLPGSHKAYAGTLNTAFRSALYDAGLITAP